MEVPSLSVLRADMASTAMTRSGLTAFTAASTSSQVSMPVIPETPGVRADISVSPRAFQICGCSVFRCLVVISPSAHRGPMESAVIFSSPHLSLKAGDNIVSTGFTWDKLSGSFEVETTDEVAEGNNLPVTSDGVFKTVGNIETALDNIIAQQNSIIEIQNSLIGGGSQ